LTVPETQTSQHACLVLGVTAASARLHQLRGNLAAAAAAAAAAATAVAAAAAL